jgi:predicted ATPase
MFIKRLSYADEDLRWNLEEIKFDNMTLLVGLSGVGKSKILNSILNLRSIVKGDTVHLGGVTWEVEFISDKGCYIWSGKFDSLNIPYVKTRYRAQACAVSTLNANPHPKLLEEKLSKDGEEIFYRDGKKQRFKGMETPKISMERSFCELMVDDEIIADVRKGFLSIFYLDFTNDLNLLAENANALNFKNPDIKLDTKEVSISDLPLVTKLAYLYIREKDMFNNIKNKFTEIFPYVEDLIFEEDAQKRYYILYFKERNVGYIPQGSLSSGMFKTLLLLTQIELLIDKCIVLVDEAENSLGLNCIDILTEELRGMLFDDQIVFTSHHPYVINNIPINYWRIVNRKGSTVMVKTAKELDLGNSSHDAFMQLINALEYSRGISLE